MNRLSRWLLPLIALVAVAIGALFVFAPKDGAAPEDADLSIKLENLADDQNAWKALIEGAKTMSLGGIEPRGFFAENAFIASAADQLVSGNKNALQALEKAASLTQARSPASSPDVTVFSEYNTRSFEPSLLRARQLAELGLVRAEVSWRSGQSEDAWRDLMMVARLGSVLRTAKGTLLEQVVADTITRLALERLRIALPFLKFSGSEWRKKFAQLEQIPVGREPYVNALRLNYRIAKMAIQAETAKPGSVVKQSGNPVQFLRLILPRGYNFQPNRSLTWLANYTRASIIDSRSCPPGQSSDVSSKQLGQEINAPNANVIGQAIMVRTSENTQSDITEQCALELARAAALISSGIQAFKTQFDSLPSKLEDLRTIGLQNIPNDVYAPGAKPFQFDAKAATLRSVSGLLIQIGQ
jgi:hypothetical protein